MNQSRTDPGGPVIAVCAGQRCRALRELRGPEAGLEPLKTAVAQTRGGVLISTGCLGRCNLAAVVVLVWRGETHRDPIPLAGMDASDRAHALTGWLSGTGPAATLLQAAAYPPHLPPPTPQPTPTNRITFSRQQEPP